MVPIGVQGLLRQGVDGFRSDQRLDVFYVGISGILGAGARPQNSLGARALMGQRLKAFVSKNFLVNLIGLPGAKRSSLKISL